MGKKKLIILFLLTIILVSTVSSYVIINEEDNQQVKEFKNRMNLLSLEEDRNKGMNDEAIYNKIRYFTK